jgi:hypothetical protein
MVCFAYDQTFFEMIRVGAMGVVYVVLDVVFSRFGILIEVLGNRGTNYVGKFQKLCEKTLINHHITL